MLDSSKDIIYSCLSIILFSPVKKSSHLNQERNMHRSSTNYKPKQSETYSSKQMCRGGLFVRGQQGMDFSIEEVLLWILD